ncbi:unnamed protein product, partial [Brassica oleracea var. botrytis]
PQISLPFFFFSKRYVLLCFFSFHFFIFPFFSTYCSSHVRSFFHLNKVWRVVREESAVD